MTAVTFDAEAFKGRYPEFVAVAEATLTVVFDEACLLIDNGDASPVSDVTRRKIMLWLAVAHLAKLGRLTEQAMDIQSDVPTGRLSTAHEGSVTATFSVGPETDENAFWLQTAYGQQLWKLMAPYRQAVYVPGTAYPPSWEDDPYGFTNGW
ncbi:DUF4054 domain-containing protein [Zymobacter sp. IVIA_12111.31 C1]|uniref:DUF4054 domain-containing protein n=1 Tax=Zymobacter sp. IVIA_12111.31 C1 TaxID=3394854 RepID=UPI0039C45EDC